MVNISMLLRSERASVSERNVCSSTLARSNTCSLPQPTTSWCTIGPGYDLVGYTPVRENESAGRSENEDRRSSTRTAEIRRHLRPTLFGATLSAPLLRLLVSESLYFDTAALILVFITLGNYLEPRSKGQASEALRTLLELQADTGSIVDEDGTEREVAVEEIEIGDRMRVRPGEQLPIDGVVDGTTVRRCGKSQSGGRRR